MIDLPSYNLERTFNAPRALVWKTWTDPSLLAKWYGPNVETVVHRLDVKPGGLWLTEMKMGGKSGYLRAEFTEVIEPQRLVCLMSNADSHWNIAPNPMMPDWPRVLLTTVRFDEVEGGTKMNLTWVPHDATPTEISCFSAAIEGMGKGWAAGMELLEKLLADMQA